MNKEQKKFFLQEMSSLSNDPSLTLRPAGGVLRELFSIYEDTLQPFDIENVIEVLQSVNSKLKELA